MKNQKKGLTLIEVVLTVALVGLVLQVIFSVFFVGNKSYNVSTNKGFSQQDVRLVGNFVTSELKYVTDISDSDDYIGEYYSIKVDNKNGEKTFIKTKHIYNGDGTESSKDTITEKTKIASLTGNWKSIAIKTEDDEENKRISIFITQEEGKVGQESKYDLELDVITLNNPSLSKDINIDLIDGEILYYRNSLPSLLTTGIDIKESYAVGNRTITFKTDNEFYYNTTQEIGSDIIFPPIYPIKEGFAFNGWNPNISIMPGIDLTLEANWKSSLEDTIINFYNGNNRIGFIKGKSGTLVEIIPSPEGGNFSNWNTNKDGSGISYAPQQKFEIPTTDLDIYAIWHHGDLYGLEIVRVSTAEKSSNIKMSKPPNGYYTVGNNNTIYIDLKFQYNSSNDKLEINATGYSGNILGSDESKTVTLIGTGPKNKDEIITINIEIREKANPNIKTTTVLKLKS